MDIATVQCNVCGRQKQETNHWLVAIVVPTFEGIVFEPAETFTSRQNPALQFEDICGHACAHKRLSQWLETLNATERKIA